MGTIMQTRVKRLAVLSMALLLAACGAQGPGGYGLFAYDCPADADKALADVDWDKAERLAVTVRHDEYTPMVIPLIKGRAYVMGFENRDDYNHRLEAPDFFRSVALKDISVAGASTGADTCIRGLGLPPGKTVSVRLVTLADGRYPFEESALGTMFMGASFGVITVE